MNILVYFLFALLAFLPVNTFATLFPTDAILFGAAQTSWRAEDFSFLHRFLIYVGVIYHFGFYFAVRNEDINGRKALLIALALVAVAAVGAVGVVAIRSAAEPEAEESEVVFNAKSTENTEGSLEVFEGLSEECLSSGFAPMTRNGHRTHLYELVRELNLEIQQRAFVWAGGQVERVSHLADTIPIGTHPLEQLPLHFLTLQNQKGSGLVSEISNGGRNFVMLLNTTYTREWHVRVETDDNVQLVRTDGTLAPACCYDQLHILSPGNCEIFEVRK